jgi:hypothetical protein
MLGTLEVPLTFEEDLIELSLKMGRPHPELKGGRVDKPEDSKQTWLVSCMIRGVVLDPSIEEIEMDVLDRTWEEGSIRAMQATLAERSERRTGPSPSFGAVSSLRGCLVPSHIYPSQSLAATI